MHEEHVQLAPLAEGAFIPAPDQLNAITGGAAGFSFAGAGSGAAKSYDGRDAGNVDRAIFLAATGGSIGENGDGKV